jgi:formate dehydrogenase major subunit
VERAARLTPKELDKRERRKSFREVEQTADVEAALHEAYRCLECGCGKVADCTLRDLAMRYGVEKNRFDSPAKRYQTDTRHPYIVRDPDKCIKCARCIRICHEVQGIGALAYEGRGFSMQAAPPFGWPLQDSGCESCGQCVTACPTGALTEKPVLQPSLSLFTELTTTVCAHCGIACGITVHTAGARIAKITPQNNANLCEKGKFRFAYLSNEERIVFPARKANGRLKRVSWDEAASIFSERVAPLDGRRIAVFVSPRLSSEDAFHAQKFARTILETNNLYPLATRTYLKPFLKKMLPFVSPSPIDACATSDAVVLVDPDTVARNEVAALNLIQAVRNGARLLIVGGKRTKLDTFAVHKLRVNPNRPELYRRALADFTRGARRPFLVYNRNCIEEKAIRQLHGYALKSGINIVSLTGEINEQGLLREGVSPFLIPGYEMLGNRNAVKRLEKKWKHGIPSWEGKRYTTLLRESVNGRIKAAVIFGDASVEDAALARALRRVPFVAAQTTRYTGLARRAHLILPVQSWIESAGTVTLYDGKKRRFKRAIPPLSGYTNREIMKLLASRIIIPRR